MIENFLFCCGIRLVNIGEGFFGIFNKKFFLSFFRVFLFEFLRGFNKKSFFLDSDSEFDDDIDYMGGLSGEGDSDMEFDELDWWFVFMVIGIIYDYFYVWVLDGRVVSLNEGNGMFGYIYVRFN